MVATTRDGRNTKKGEHKERRRVWWGYEAKVGTLGEYKVHMRTTRSVEIKGKPKLNDPKVTLE